MNFPLVSISRHVAFAATAATGIACIQLLTGCYAGFKTIDHRVNALLVENSENLGDGAPAPRVNSYEQLSSTEEDMDNKQPSTWNPSADQLTYVPTAKTDAEEVLQRLDAYQQAADNAPVIGLQEALEWSFSNSQEYQFAEEDYVLSCLALLIEQHRWVPRISDTLIPTYDANAIRTESDDRLYETAFRLVNEWQVEQKLPYGGQVTAGWLSTFSKELHGKVGSSENPSELTSQFNLGASIPFLRGAGPVAQESLIQSERNVVYAARKFESFRREFLVRITTEFLNLQVLRRKLRHQEVSLTYYEQKASRAMALFQSGRTKRLDAANAENDVLSSRSKVAQLWEQYRLAVDQFKRLIGYPIDEDIIISEEALALAVPEIEMSGAVEISLTNRLDLQTERDQLVDLQRAIRNAENALLPDLNLNLSATAPSKETGTGGGWTWDGVTPSFRDIDYSAGLSFGLPLDREIERLAVRQGQINLERAQRAFILFRDTVVINVRAAVRDIDAFLFTLDLQRRNVRVAQLAIDQIEVDPDRFDLLQTQNAIEQLQQAQDDRDAAFRDVQVSILKYLERSGQLRVNPDGTLQLLPGMELLPYDDLAIEGPSA